MRSSIKVKKTRQVAVLVSDIHMSDKAPIARKDPNWLDTTKHHLAQLAEFDLPIFCAGDIFHKWNSSAELINFALTYMPKMWAIPGQHDLPYHSHDQVHKSAYWTMVMAGKVNPVPNGTFIHVPSKGTDLFVYGAAWGVPIDEFHIQKAWDRFTKARTVPKNGLRLAMIHKYIWKDGHSFPGAAEEDNVQSKALEKTWKEFDVALIGDNHSPFTYSAAGYKDNCRIWNNGSFMQRNKGDKPGRYGILMSDGRVVTQYMNPHEAEVFDPSVSEPATPLPFTADNVIERISQMVHDTDSWKSIVNFWMQSNPKIKSDVKKIIQELVGDL